MDNRELKPKILFTGGGTGGHTMPIIAIAREIKKIAEVELQYIGPKGDFESLSQEGFKLHSILGGKIRRYFSFLNFVDILFKIPVSFLQSFFLLVFLKPNVVFSKGGTGSVPVTFSARLLWIPVFIHESDVAPGLSNRMTSKWAKKIFTSFETTEFFNPAKVTVSGNPIRKDLLIGNALEARQALSLTSEKPVVFIFGGSQGSQPINEFILSILQKLLEKYEILHAVGPNNHKAAQSQAQLMVTNADLLASYYLYEFLNEVELKNAYWACDMVISRAGSGSIFEIAAMGKPCMLIPLPTAANDHQSKNAYQYAKSLGGIVLEQESLSPGFFMGEVESVLSKREIMRDSALKFAKPDAAEFIAAHILTSINEKSQQTTK